MNEAWATVAGLAVTTALIKASGPVLLGGRHLPAWATDVVDLLAPALLAALIVTGTFGDRTSLTLDARALGIGAAALALIIRRSAVIAVVVAAGVTALARAVG